MTEIVFKSDTSHRKKWFTGSSISHPAKMSLPLQLYLIDRYTKEGETILDPMAGSGTILVACSLGRHVITCELEQKFVDMQKGNWEKIQQRGPQMGYRMGNATILLGDARNLESVLCDHIITSPPYEGSLELSSRHTKGGIPSRDAKLGQTGTYATLDHIITSPPYAEVNHHSDDPKDLEAFTPGRSARVGGTAGESENNLGRLPYGSIDSVITSPPYEGSLAGPKADILHKAELLEVAGYDSQKWLGNARCQQMRAEYNPENRDNIGNLKGESYLSAMLLVYQQCFKVLKPQGLLILVLKNFIRNKQIVRLDLDTIKLCEQAGFTLKERLERKLTQQSFWRILYARKYPLAPRIDCEDILIFSK